MQTLEQIGQMVEDLLGEVRGLRAELRDLRDKVQPTYPPELTLAQAMKVTNHNHPRTFHDWCKRKKVRPLSRGRYSLRRLQAAMAA